MNEGKSLRLIGYVRVSTDKQAEDGVSPDVQRKQIENYCKQHGHELIEIYTDAGVSAAELHRPGLGRVLESLNQARTLDIQGVVVAKLDRLTRSVRDWVYLLDQYFRHTSFLTLISCSEQVDTKTAAGRFMLYVHFALAELELDRTTERTVSSVDHKREAGQRIGTVPYGFKVDPLGKKSNRGKLTDLIPDEPEQTILAVMQERRSSGLSIREIAMQFNEYKIPTRSGRPWTASGIHSLLSRPDPCLPNPNPPPNIEPSQSSSAT